MSSYYTHSSDEELDIRIHRNHDHHRGRSPSHGRPVVYPEARYVSRPAPRPYHGGESSYLVPAVSTSLHRSRSTGHRASPPAPPSPQPIVINNRIYNDYDDDEYGLAPPPPRAARSRSRSRPEAYIETRRDPRDEYEIERARRELEDYKLAHTRDEYEMERAKRDLQLYKQAHTRDEYEIERKRRELDAYRAVHDREEYELEKTYSNLEKTRRELEKHKISSTKEEMELEKTKKELKAFKEKEERKAEEARMKKEYEMQKLLDEKKAEDEKKRLRKEADAAIEKYKIEEAEKAAKQKKEKEQREKEYQARFEEDLRKSGMDERQISVVLKKDKGVDPNRPTYTRMSRRHLSIETLNKYRIDYEFDQDPDYVLIKRWVPEFEQDFLWTHTREIRERRRSEVVLSIEGVKKKHHETEFELVRKKKHERKPSPSPLLTFLAGGKHR